MKEVTCTICDIEKSKYRRNSICENCYWDTDKYWGKKLNKRKLRKIEISIKTKKIRDGG